MLSGALKEKDLCMMPARLALALQADGWTLRQEIIWSKKNCMPESVRDRCTKSHETVFLFAKRSRYYFDSLAIAEDMAHSSIPRVVERPDLRSQGVVLRQNLGFQETSMHPPRPPASLSQHGRFFSICIRLATAILQLAQLEQEVGMAALDTEVRQQHPGNIDGALITDMPDIQRAALLATRFLDTNLSAKDFLAQLDSLGITLNNSDMLRKIRVMALEVMPGDINVNGYAPIRINDASDVGQFQLESLTNSHTPSSFVYDETIEANIPYSSNKRNARSVWKIATEPCSLAHFATMPQELAARCIKAGTSAHGVCSGCGSPWKRVAERQEQEEERPYLEVPLHRKSEAFGLNGRNVQAKNNESERRNKIGTFSNNPRLRPVRKTGDTWEPTCRCFYGPGYAEPVRAVVLDPFAGSGTTGLAARALGRSAVLLDLSLPYLRDIARERLGLTALHAWEPGRTPQPDIYHHLPLFSLGGEVGK